MDKIIRWIKNKFKGEKAENELNIVQFKGNTEYSVPMSTYRLTYEFVTKSEILEPEYIDKISEELNSPKNIVRADLKRLMKGAVKKTVICMEYPYVDEYYRDTYYSYYSRKHTPYNRFCFRLSFFTHTVSIENFYSIENLEEYFLGYAVLRPTPKRIIGTTFLSPKLYGNLEMSVCLCHKTVSILGRFLTVYGFPFSGQDGEMNTCSETAIALIFDYFSNRYNRYSRLLPSQIAAAISGIVDRKQPSKGVDIDTVASVMNSFGVNSKLYLKSNEGEQENTGDGIHFLEDEFKRLLHIYIESGIPLYVVTINHAFVAIGRENKLFAGNPKIVIMDDNQKPYVFLEDENNIWGFIVPMADNILLEAMDIDIREIIGKISSDYPSASIIGEETNFYYRLLLTTSRSYKNYILNQDISSETRDYIIGTAMPKFVWVCEVISYDDVEKQIDDIDIQTVIILDTTDNSKDYNHLLLAKSKQSILIPGDDRTHMQRKQYLVYDSTERLRPFKNNLKGEHTSWRH